MKQETDMPQNVIRAAVISAVQKKIAVALMIVQGAIACALLRLIWDEPLKSAYGLIFLIAGLLGAFEVGLLFGWFKNSQEPLFDRRQGITWILFGGVGAALLLCCGLMFLEYQERESDRIMQADAVAERALRQQMLSGVDVNAIKTLTDLRAASQPAK